MRLDSEKESKKLVKGKETTIEAHRHSWRNDGNYSVDRCVNQWIKAEEEPFVLAIEVEVVDFLGSLQESFAELLDVIKEQDWRQSSGRSTAENGQKGLDDCKIHGFYRIFKRSGVSGNHDETVFIRFDVDLMNEVLKPSNFYDSMKNPNYVFGKPFPFPVTYKWLLENKSELYPASSIVTVDENKD